jgi:hypothetical protein
MVPREEDAEGERTEFDDLDDLVNPVAIRPVQTIAPVATRPAPSPAPRTARPALEPLPLPPEERPLFERDLEAVLGVTNGSSDAEGAAKPRPAPTAGIDAMSLAPERNHITISPQLATGMAVAVVVLMALSFGAGFLIASR